MSIYLGNKKLAGSVKLYSGTGQNTDGAMTQKATTDALNSKANIGASYTKAESDGLLENKASTSLSNITANGKEVIAHNAMPSGRFVNLTLGASGTTYTAPADGYVYFERGATSGNKYISLFNTSTGMSSAGITISGISNAKIFLPVKKNDVFRVDYTADTANPPFRFIYAQGAQ